MAPNGPIAQTEFSPITVGTIIKHADFEAISSAITKLAGYAANVDNCGNCSPANCCQSQSCQSQTCQSCQGCQTCQGCQSQSCQDQCRRPSNCSNCNC